MTSFLQYVFNAPQGVVCKDKVAAFDMDGTIIKTKSGRVFARDYEDWVFWDPVVPKVLTKLSETHMVVFITNQKGISKNKPSPEDFEKKLKSISDKLGIHLVVIAATEDDEYRKPNVGMWGLVEEQIKLDKKSSFYIGDAAGREGDFSCSDRKFALNVGVEFYTPEVYFLKKEPKEYELGFDPRLWVDTDQSQSDTMYQKPGVTLLVGMPGSGKSSFYRRNFKPYGYVYINQDTLKTKKKCETEYVKALNSGKDIVVDNTNPSVLSRKFYITQAKLANVVVRCLYFDVTKECAQHLNVCRDRLGERKKVPTIVYRMYNKKFEYPMVDEGFEEVDTVDFIPHFSGKRERRNFLIYS